MFVAGSFPVALPASTTSTSPGTPTGARMLLFLEGALIKTSPLAPIVVIAPVNQGSPSNGFMYLCDEVRLGNTMVQARYSASSLGNLGELATQHMCVFLIITVA